MVQWTLFINGTNHGPLVMMPAVTNIVSGGKHAFAKDPLVLPSFPLVQYNLIGSVFPSDGPHQLASRKITPKLQAPVNISVQVCTEQKGHLSEKVSYAFPLATNTDQETTLHDRFILDLKGCLVDISFPF
jgi:hypothetical protein